jgi:hypothetical protein
MATVTAWLNVSTWSPVLGMGSIVRHCRRFQECLLSGPSARTFGLFWWRCFTLRGYVSRRIANWSTENWWRSWSHVTVF